MSRAIGFDTIRFDRDFPLESRSAFRGIERHTEASISAGLLSPTIEWKHKCAVATNAISRASDGYRKYRAQVYIEDEIYYWVSYGTKEHYIYPKNKNPDGTMKKLKYMHTFTPKTSPKSLKSVPGGKSPPIYASEWEKHPGIKARGFDKSVAQALRGTGGDTSVVRYTMNVYAQWTMDVLAKHLLELSGAR